MSSPRETARYSHIVKASAAMVALFVFGGCSEHRPASEAVHLSIEDARNATYRTEWGKSGSVTLSEGLFSFPLRARLEAVAAGDLDQDGGADLAAVVVFRPGGTGAFYELHALVGFDGLPQDAGSAQLGDRIRVESLSIDHALITVRLLDLRDGESYAAEPRAWLSSAASHCAAARWPKYHHRNDPRASFLQSPPVVQTLPTPTATLTSFPVRGTLSA